MPAWNNDNFYTLSALHSANQLWYFYDGAPRLSRCPKIQAKIQALDEEIDAFVQTILQQEKWVYGSAPTFRWYAVNLARPLLKRRQKACRKFNERSAVYSLLPPEILSTIFEFAVDCSVTPRIFTPPKLSPTLVLASVTSLWRSLVLSTPKLWNSFRLLPADDDENQDRLDQLKHFLQRSGTVDLHIHLKLSRSWSECLDELVDIIHRQRSRIRTFSIDSDERLPEFLHHFFPTFATATHLRLDTAQGHLGYLSSLTSLDITKASLYELRVVLQTARALKRLEVGMAWDYPPQLIEISEDFEILLVSGFAPNATTVKVEPWVHHGLEVLKIDDGNALHTLTLPNLKGLYARGTHTAIAPFIARSGCRLVGFGVAHPFHLDSIVALDTVQELYVDANEAMDSNRIFNALMERTDLHLESIIVCIDYHESERGPPSTANHGEILSTLVDFHSRCGANLAAFEIRTLALLGFEEIEHAIRNTTPGYCPIIVNGHPLEYFRDRLVWDRQYRGLYHLAPLGRDRLNSLDRVLEVSIDAWRMFKCAVDFLWNRFLRPSNRVEQGSQWGVPAGDSVLDDWYAAWKDVDN